VPSPARATTMAPTRRVDTSAQAVPPIAGKLDISLRGPTSGEVAFGIWFPLAALAPSPVGALAVPLLVASKQINMWCRREASDAQFS